MFCERWPTSSETIRHLTSVDKAWFPGSVVFDLNSVLELKNSTKILVLLLSLKRSNGAGLDTLATSREWIHIFGQEE